MRAFFLVGATATGKSAVAQYIAEKNRCGIVSADSMMVYRGMDIGTAKPTVEERGDVPYYCIDLVEPSESFSVWDFRQAALSALREKQKSEGGLIVAGGTGLYIKSLTHGLSKNAGADIELRAYWEKRVEKEGVAVLQAHLKEVAPDVYARLADRENPRRLIRALESSRHPMGVQSWESLRGETPVVGLRMDNSLLHERIKRRVEMMIEDGLVDEVRQLLDGAISLSATAMQAIGYAEVMEYIKGRMSRDEAIERTVIRTRQLAKRQRTWFRNKTRVEWVDVSADCGVAEIAEKVEALWRRYGATEIRD